MTATAIIDESQIGQYFQRELFDSVRDMDYTKPLEKYHGNLQKRHSIWFSVGGFGFDDEAIPWPPLSPRTIRKKGHARKLIDSGDLRRSLTQKSGKGAIRSIEKQGSLFGTSIEYAGYHMTGTANMPARPHTGADKLSVDLLMHQVADHIVKEMKQ